jgi:hypothetical protein
VAEQMQDLKNTISGLTHAMIERDKRMTRIERSIKLIDVEEITQKIQFLTDILAGSDGKNGLRKSVDRMLILIDGDERYCVVGLAEQIADLKKEVDKLVLQRNQIKWAIVGMSILTGLGNAEGIFKLLQPLLFP